jgi:hypothetical protein
VRRVAVGYRDSISIHILLLSCFLLCMGMEKRDKKYERKKGLFHTLMYLPIIYTRDATAIANAVLRLVFNQSCYVESILYSVLFRLK